MAKNDPIEVRIEKMAQWANGVNEQLADLTAAMVVSTEQHADGIALQLADLLSSHSANREDYAAALDVKAQLSVDNELDDKLATIEAETMLDVSAAVDEKGKARYSNAEMRQAAVTVALNGNDEYGKLRDQKRQQQRDVACARAVLEALDREASEYKRATDNLVARLDNLTARVGARHQ